MEFKLGDKLITTDASGTILPVGSEVEIIEVEQNPKAIYNYKTKNSDGLITWLAECQLSYPKAVLKYTRDNIIGIVFKASHGTTEPWKIKAIEGDVVLNHKLGNEQYCDRNSIDWVIALLNNGDWQVVEMPSQSPAEESYSIF